MFQRTLGLTTAQVSHDKDSRLRAYAELAHGRK